MINFIKNKKIYFTISIVLIALTVIIGVVFGANLDIQFKGGSLTTYSYEGDTPDLAEVAKIVEDITGSRVTVQEGTVLATGDKSISVTLADSKGIEAATQKIIVDSLTERFPDNNIVTLSSSNVSPTIGKDFRMKALLAVIFAAVLMILYIALRFRKIGGWSAGCVAVMALIHDVIIVTLVFLVCRMTIGNNYIAVILTILGYSVNDTIVIYDRIRENKRIHGGRLTLDELVNLSINQSLRRCLNTSITTAIALLVVSAVALIYGVSSIISFTIPMLFGVVSGAFSSLCLTGPVWAMWQNKRALKKA